MNTISALIADDEPLLRERLRSHLAALWPALTVIGDARNGAEALELFELHQPDIVFLDIRMPGLDGIATARALARRAQLVFVTAYDQYALQAFEQGAVDYLVKPVDPARLADTVQRLQGRLATRLADGGALDAMLDQLASRLGQRAAAPAWLHWIRASVGNSVRLIPVEQVRYLRAEEKYTLVAWEEGEALIRTSIKELGEQLDPGRFVQIHRAVIVNLAYVSQVTRGMNETAQLHLRGSDETLPVSRSYLQHFRQM
ncbi:LytR/AlgR family response regulator transcription factor [Janthinobacterium sp. 1_2014MBL_MicDiv]|uniref:LytR/AlgR family response regulator transcription factor n=1 Tax=Janthinobacterium sp. 1_2014MBL_MicDiv TaxID=1644131 RepID=UPI0008F49131|nr:LytTR family DNA-binding domain-containing protein [Janthinobacterium sp. 1_2014MBL_MicDiv]APA68455.1 transcriptional regulator [Janthinobacterium sp. 1_2014MBL_MicDiv]